MNTTLENLTQALEDFGFVVPLAGMSVQRVCGDHDSGLTASCSIEEGGVIEFGLTERTEGSAVNVLHCVVDTEDRQAWLLSEHFSELNGERTLGVIASDSLRDVFECLEEFILVRRPPLELQQIMEGLPSCLETDTSRGLMAAVFKRFGMESVYMPPFEAHTDHTPKPELALHDLAVLARYAREEMRKKDHAVFRIPLENKGELLLFPPERALMYAAASRPQRQHAAGEGV